MTPTDWIIALATAVIAFYSVALWRATQKAGEREEEFRGQLSDLYQAIVVATVISAIGYAEEPEPVIRQFRQH